MSTTCCEPQPKKQRLSPAEQDAAAAAHYPILISMAQRWWSGKLYQCVNLDDLIGAGSIRLATSLNAYDPSSRTPLGAWLRLHIKWGFLDYLRKLDPLSQEKRRLVRVVQKAREELALILQRPPTDQEIAEFLNMSSEQDIVRILQYGNAHAVSLDDPAVSDLEDSHATANADEVMARRHLEQGIAHARLSDDERTAIRMRLENHDVTLAEIAKELDLSVETARRRLASGLLTLKLYLDEERNRHES